MKVSRSSFIEFSMRTSKKLQVLNFSANIYVNSYVGVRVETVLQA